MFWLKQVYYGLMGISLLALLVNYSRLSKSIRIFVPIILLAILTQAAGDLLKANGKDHFFLFHIYIPAEYGLLCVYYHAIIKNRWLKSIIAVSAVVLIIYYGIYYMLDGAAFLAKSFGDFVITSLLISIWTLAYFTELFHQEAKINLVRYPNFWINTGNILFYAGCLFVMGFYFSLEKKDASLAQKILLLHVSERSGYRKSHHCRHLAAVVLCRHDYMVCGGLQETP